MRSFLPDDVESGGSASDGDGDGSPTGGKLETEGMYNGKSLESLTWKEDAQRTDVKRGAFSAQEKEKLFDALREYECDNNLTREQIMEAFSVGNKDKGRQSKAVVVKVAARALPHRTRYAVYSFLVRTLTPAAKRNVPFSAEEDTILKAHVAVHGTDDWISLSERLGRLHSACRDRWRALAWGHNDAMNTGRWSQEEEGLLVNLVRDYEVIKRKMEEADERAQMDEEQEAAAIAAEREGRGDVTGDGKNKRKKGLMRRVGGRSLLDDIDWDLIAQQMNYKRNGEQCRHKWYGQLSSSMVERGDWGVGDDKRMLEALRGGGYEVEWEVPWGSLVEGRTEQATKRRWLLMLKAVHGYRDMEFLEIVDYLVERYIKKKRQTIQEEAEDESEGGGEGEREESEHLQQSQQPQEQQRQEKASKDEKRRRKEERKSRREEQQQGGEDAEQQQQQQQSQQEQDEQEQPSKQEHKRRKEDRKRRRREEEQQEGEDEEQQAQQTQEEHNEEQQLSREERKRRKEERKKRRREEGGEDEEPQVQMWENQDKEEQPSREERKRKKEEQKARKEEKKRKQEGGVYEVQQVQDQEDQDEQPSREERKRRKEEQKRRKDKEQQQQQASHINEQGDEQLSKKDREKLLHDQQQLHELSNEHRKQAKQRQKGQQQEQLHELGKEDRKEAKRQREDEQQHGQQQSYDLSKGAGKKKKKEKAEE